MSLDVPARRWLVLQRVLMVAGIACLGWYAYINAAAWLYQRTHRTVAVQAPPASEPPISSRERPAATPSVAPPSEIPIGDAIGTIEVPRLHLSAVVANGDDDGTLKVAIGHLPDTPLPWEDGNSALAGHRDTFFRGLRGIRVNDQLRVRTAYGEYVYQVKRIVIVTPHDLSVLDPTPQPTLTLVTCYPFSYVGHAPKRFIVQAERVDVQPASANAL